jgi:hypothetical protein
VKNTEYLDNALRKFDNENIFYEVKIDFIREMIKYCPTDSKENSKLWNLEALDSALETIKSQSGDRAYLVVKRSRDIKQRRNETQGILSGGEERLAPKDALTLFIYRQNAIPQRDEIDVWWPQLRFPQGRYVLSFSFDW